MEEDARLQRLRQKGYSGVSPQALAEQRPYGPSYANASSSHMTATRASSTLLAHSYTSSGTNKHPGVTHGALLHSPLLLRLLLHMPLPLFFTTLHYHTTLFYTILLYSTLLYSTLLYTVLLYSTLLSTNHCRVRLCITEVCEEGRRSMSPPELVSSTSHPPLPHHRQARELHRMHVVAFVLFPLPSLSRSSLSLWRRWSQASPCPGARTGAQVKRAEHR